MSEEKRTIGYICPVCGQAVIASRTAFQLAAGDSKLPCPCGKSELSFHQTGDRCEVTVPCLFCARDHRAVCANDALLHRKLLALSCPASGLGCCYVGQEGPVFRAMEKLEAAVDKLRRIFERGGDGGDAVRAEGHRRPGRGEMRLRLGGLRRKSGLLLSGPGVRPLRGSASSACRRVGRPGLPVRPRYPHHPRKEGVTFERDL